MRWVRKVSPETVKAAAKNIGGLQSYARQSAVSHPALRLSRLKQTRTRQRFEPLRSSPSFTRRREYP
jgi:hypothetical protein